MKTNKINGKKVVISSVIAAVLIVSGSVTAMAAANDAAEDGIVEETAVSYGYHAGQQQGNDRKVQFETAASLTDDTEREAYLAEQGIGGGAYSASQHLDAEELVTAGVIDQGTADNITAYASGKHDQIHDRYGNTADMTPSERHSMYERFESDGFDGDSVSELLDAGVITQAQADAINAYVG